MLLKTTTALMIAVAATTASALEVRVTIENIAPTGGTVLTPVWVGFHDGSFDSYDGGLTAQEGLERIAEDGNTADLSTDFLAGRTYVQGGVSGVFDNAQDGSERVDATLATASPGPLTPGQSVSQNFTIEANGTNRYFSYATMVLPSNDFFVANGNPFAHDLLSLYDGQGSISFNIGQAGTVNDAGTEAEDFDTAAPPIGPLQGLFPTAGFGGNAGQTGANQGAADTNNLIRNVIGDPYAGFANNNGFDLSLLDFNSYPRGIARVTITAVPEPTAAVLSLFGMAAVGLKRRR